MESKELESEFRRKFKQLKEKRNNYLIDEPEFDEAVEQLAADTYAHPIADGWCCACDADRAFLTAVVDMAMKKKDAQLMKMQSDIAYAIGRFQGMEVDSAYLERQYPEWKTWSEVEQPQLLKGDQDAKRN